MIGQLILINANSNSLLKCNLCPWSTPNDEHDTQPCAVNVISALQLMNWVNSWFLLQPFQDLVFSLHCHAVSDVNTVLEFTCDYHVQNQMWHCISNTSLRNWLHSDCIMSSTYHCILTLCAYNNWLHKCHSQKKLQKVHHDCISQFM